MPHTETRIKDGTMASVGWFLVLFLCMEQTHESVQNTPPHHAARERAKALADDFYRFLKSEDLLKEEPDFDPHVEWSIKARVNLQLYNNMRMILFMIRNDEPLRTWCKKYDLYDTFEEERGVMPFVLLAEYSQSAYEILKRVLLRGLDLGKMNLGKGTPTYGKIISKLEERGLAAEIVSIMNNKLRNVLAHGSWYVDDDHKFHDETGEIILSYNDFLTRADDFAYFANRYYLLYWKEHMTDKITDFARKKIIEISERYQSAT